MLLDKLLALSDGQALTGSADSENVVDLVQTARQIGPGKTVWVNFNVVVAADLANGDETYQFKISTGATNALGTELASRTIAKEDLIVGYKFNMAFPIADVERYVGVEYVLGGTSPSITIDAHISDQEIPTSTQSYPDALAPVS